MIWSKSDYNSVNLHWSEKIDKATHTKMKNDLRENLEMILDSEMPAGLKKSLNDPDEHSIYCLNCGKMIPDTTEMDILMLDNPFYVTCPECKQVIKVSDNCELNPVANTANYIEDVEKYVTCQNELHSMTVRNLMIRCSGKLTGMSL